MNDLITKILSFISKYFNPIQFEKKRIRQEIRFQKKSVSKEQKQIAANAIFDKIELLPEFKTANTILIYWAMPDELPTQNTIKNWCKEKQILLPSIDRNRLVLKKYSPDGRLTQKNLGFWEPDLSENYDGNIDMVIVPGIAFDNNKNRLGRGKGYFDRFFKKYKPLKIGVGYDFQLMNKVPISKHDVKMDKIVTPSETIE
jgi:5-formyltetrahydrofolate cyclo-ligase